jgi:acyl-CoA thioester hydrolase
VFNGHYLTYCDVCITEYWRSVGLRYPEDFVAHGGDIFVRKATLLYHAAAVYDDELVVCGRVARLGRSSAVFAIEMFRAANHDAVLVDAELVYVHADPVAKKARPWPDPFRERVRTFEISPPVEGGGT